MFQVIVTIRAGKLYGINVHIYPTILKFQEISTEKTDQEKLDVNQDDVASDLQYTT